MLKVPQKTDLALMLMRQLASCHATKQPLSLEEVAKTGRISQGYLEEVARLLRAAKLITGRRGSHGGYILSREPADITVADVVTAIEGRKWAAECLGMSPGLSPKAVATGEALAEGGESKMLVRHAGNDAVWRKVQGQVMTTLAGISLADVATQIAKPLL